MKLLYLTNGICGSGGLERVLSVKASALAEDYDYEVHILVLNESVEQKPFFEFSEKIIRHSINVSGNPVQYWKSYKNGIKSKVAEINPDVISVCDDGLKGFFIPKILGRKIPLVYERHVSKQIELNSEMSGLQRAAVRQKFRMMDFLATDFDKFVVLTPGNKSEWPLLNLDVIPNPLSFLPDKVSTLQNRKVIAVGKQSYQKGYDLLLQSWALLHDKKSGWELHIYGKQEPNLKLENLAEKLGISNSVFFHSPEKNIVEKYQDSSVFVLSSRFEGFGMVLIEAMSCGVPCISFDCPHGPGDIINDGKDGFLVENGNIEKFAEKLSLLINDEQLRKEMGNNARQTSENYKPENILKVWDALFKKLKSKHPTSKSERPKA